MTMMAKLEMREENMAESRDFEIKRDYKRI